MAYEFDPLTGKTRGWYECRDKNNNVNRIHPKYENGESIDKPHYPPTARDQNQ